MNDEEMARRLEYTVTAWGLAGPTLIAETPTSNVYVVSSGGEQVILKLLTPSGAKDEGSGVEALRWWDGKAAVRLIEADEQAHLLEYAAGDDLVGMVRRGDDDRATAIIARVLNQLHAPKAAGLPEGLIPLKTWFRDLFIKAETDSGEGLNSICVRAASMAERLLADPRDVRVLHGDIHHGNIRHHAARGWLAFDPKGLVGERTFDTANTLCNPLELPEIVEDERRLRRRVSILAGETGIEVGRILAFGFVYVCLSACWLLSDGLDADHELRMAAIIERQLKGI